MWLHLNTLILNVHCWFAELNVAVRHLRFFAVDFGIFLIEYQSFIFSKFYGQLCRQHQSVVFLLHSTYCYFIC